MDNRSYYFQTITRVFLELRGAPFFLSSKELTLIEQWETAGIPLRVALEGIKQSFGTRKKTQKAPRRKVLSLAFCEPQVKEAFALFRDREVGRKKMGIFNEKKKKAIRISITQFLSETPQEAGWLKLPFQKVLDSLARLSEEELEKADGEIEDILVKKATPLDIKEIKKAALAEFPEATGKESQRIFRILLIKHMRDKYKIPHVAPYFY